MRVVNLKGAGLVLCVLMLAAVAAMGTQNVVRAAPALAITGTPTEPAPPTATAQPTVLPTAAVQPTALPTATAEPAVSSANPRPRVVITKTVDVADVAVGELLGFSMFVSNDGDRTANDVVVTDALPSYLERLDATTNQGVVSVSGQTVTVELGALGAGQTVLIRIRAYVRAGAPEAGSNTATTSTGADSTVAFRVRPGVPTATPAPSATPPQPTAVPPQPTAAPPQPTAAPPQPTVPPRQPTAAPRPARLPVTAEGGSSSAMWYLAVIGLVGVALGVTIRRKI